MVEHWTCPPVSTALDDGCTLFSRALIIFKSIFFNNSFWHSCPLNVDNNIGLLSYQVPPRFDTKSNDAIEFREVLFGLIKSRCRKILLLAK